MELGELLVLVFLPMIVGILVAVATRLSTARFWIVVALGVGVILAVAGVSLLLRSDPTQANDQAMAVLVVFFLSPLIVAALAGRLSLAFTSNLSGGPRVAAAAVAATLA